MSIQDREWLKTQIIDLWIFENLTMAQIFKKLEIEEHSDKAETAFQLFLEIRKEFFENIFED